jgi:hypothetical protein
MIDKGEDCLTYLSTHGYHKQFNTREEPAHAPMIFAITVVALMTLFVILDTSGGCDDTR